jgi:hypothetical protein
MWRAWPIVSAKTVAQNPAGIVNVVSQAGVAAAVVAVDDAFSPPVHAQTATIAAEDRKEPT